MYSLRQLNTEEMPTHSRLTSMSSLVLLPIVMNEPCFPTCRPGWHRLNCGWLETDYLDLILVGSSVPERAQLKILYQLSFTQRLHLFSPIKKKLWIFGCAGCLLAFPGGEDTWLPVQET